MRNDGRKRFRAAALKYEKARDLAPRLIGKGFGLVAEKIVEIANQKGIPVIQNPEIVNILMQLNENDMIPPVLYQAVAEIYAFLEMVENEHERP